MRIRHFFLLLVVLAIPVFPTASYAQEIRGVWRTLDASDEEGKRQGGIVFRANNTGEFISSTFAMSDQNDRGWMQMLETVTGGSTNLRFNYTYENSIVSMTVTHLGNLPVNRGEPWVWKAEITGNVLKLSDQGRSGKWISLTKI